VLVALLAVTVCAYCRCVRRVVSFALLAVTELILRCKMTKGIVERRIKHDAKVDVSRCLHVAQLSHIVFSCRIWV
jgi:hypothetical protein